MKKSIAVVSLVVALAAGNGKFAFAAVDFKGGQTLQTLEMMSVNDVLQSQGFDGSLRHGAVAAAKDSVMAQGNVPNAAVPGTKTEGSNRMVPIATALAALNKPDPWSRDLQASDEFLDPRRAGSPARGVGGVAHQTLECAKGQQQVAFARGVGPVEGSPFDQLGIPQSWKGAKECRIPT
jgi:hypothetical protein